MQRLDSVYYKDTGDRGRGVYTSKLLKKGDVIEVCPVILLPEHEIELIDKTNMFNYYFLWQHKQAAIALGYGSLYNHSFEPNAEYVMDFEGEVLIIRAIKNISAHDEITFNYNGDPDDKDKLWFEAK